MPRNLINYRIFIASPSGLDDIRQTFHKTLDEYNRLEAIPRDVMFEAVGWEATLPGGGRPQELINADIRTCDRAVFIFRDRWGSTTGKSSKASKFSSGCHEEWVLCNELVSNRAMQSVQLYFLPGPHEQLKDPGPQLKKVRAFRKKIEEERQHLCKNLQTDDAFAAELRASLGAWRREHEGAQPPADTPDERQRPSAPSDSPSSATTGVSANLLQHAVALIDQNPSSALAIIEASLMAEPPDSVAAEALFAKAYTLGALGHPAEELAVYDDLLARFGSATELPLREQVAKGLVNKGFRLGALGRIEDAIAVYDDLLARFGSATELPLREQVAHGLFNKGVRLGALGRIEDQIDALEDLLARFGFTEEPATAQVVALAMDSLTLLAYNAVGSR